VDRSPARKVSQCPVSAPFDTLGFTMRGIESLKELIADQKR